MVQYKTLLVFLFVFYGVSCNQKQKTVVVSGPPEVLSKEASQWVPVDNEKLILYNLISPVDVASLIDNKIAYFNSSIINPLNQITRYSTSYKMSVNIGIFGADLSYLWVFQQSQQGLSYLSAIQHLTDKMEIPRELVDITMESIENNAQNTDTLITIARNAFSATHQFLVNSGRAESASLILLGGWVESMYIALHMYNVKDITLASKILTQRYSLESILLLLENDQANQEISKNLMDLKELHQLFLQLEAGFTLNEWVNDTLQKRIILKEQSLPKIDPATFKKVHEQVSKIRTRLVD